jgi:transcription elongation factor Elf1
MKNKCPYCNKTNCIATQVFSNVDNYGGTGGTIPCLHCGKIIKVYATREVILHSVTKSNKLRDECDW